jgi:branched-chain amino acid aminotransferase
VAQSRCSEFDFRHIEFGTRATDHMLVAKYSHGAWSAPTIQPFQPLSLNPMAACLHYGQTVFEGLKAYRMATGDINIFRLQQHGVRLNRSLERMCMPPLPEDYFRAAVHAFVACEQDWVSELPGNSLYLRPFVIATEARLGVKAASEYLFVLIGAPMAAYYSKNLKVKVETQYVRAVEGGAGFAKNGGNYGAALYPTQLAHEEGYDQVLWTDGKQHLYLEESGTMNVMFVIDGVLQTPPLSGTILNGVTRDSLLTLAQADGMIIDERPISYEELEEAFKTGKKVEAFGVGTAAVIAPIELISIHGRHYHPEVSETAVFYKLKKSLEAIRTGQADDRFGWNYIIPQPARTAVTSQVGEPMIVTE